MSSTDQQQDEGQGSNDASGDRGEQRQRARGRDRRRGRNRDRSSADSNDSATASSDAGSDGQGDGASPGDAGGGGGSGDGRTKGRRNKRRRGRRRSNRQRPQGVGFWGEADKLPEPDTTVRISSDPAAVPRSLGHPPLPGHERIAQNYFELVYTRAAATAGAVAAAGGLIEPDDLIEGLGTEHDEHER